MDNHRRHFHTFDALRFFSFLLVFLHHSPIPDASVFSVFTKSGGVGVAFFFVLSGFLISYILIYEKSTAGKISLKKFFVRRILRIWPLFYLMLLIAFLTPYLLDFFGLAYSNQGYEPNWLMSVLFLENYQMIATNSFPNVSPLSVMWSLCIEEHFYIVWGLLIALLPLKRIPHLIMGAIIVAVISRLVYAHNGWASLDLFTNIDYFAFGAIPAYMLVMKNEIINKIEKISMGFKYLVVVISLALIFGLPVIKSDWLDVAAPLLYGIFFSLIIFFTLPSKNYLIIPDNLWFSKLGVFTYGLYLLHTIVINFFMQIEIFTFDKSWIAIFLLSLLTTIFLSFLSYEIFEKQFLKLKKYFL